MTLLLNAEQTAMLRVMTYSLKSIALSLEAINSKLPPCEVKEEIKQEKQETTQE